MQKNNSEFTRRAWKIIRLALLWAREGGVFRKRLGISLNTLPNYIKSLRQGGRSGGSLIYGERELSFDATPLIHVKMHRPSSLQFKMPHIPCINNPQVLDFEHDFDFNDREEFEMDYDNGVKERFSNGGDDDEIDLKAEEFITKFYEQMKLQRQISYLQYKEMLTQGTS
ncbi:Hypothetical predicted protein [Olea europaea subsp. europaea]|uniref:Uncharacterized protein n=1 Tax=Olea europaea subsp. europaea TaxID=158383 RepID=A0A8S0Q5P9_OLEEU|nr:Hypothetical predicted protein [Olea europaea subsp. europaea]